MITMTGPWSALVTLPLPPDAPSVSQVLALEKAVLAAFPEGVETIPAFNRLLVTGRPETWKDDEVEAVLSALISELNGRAEREKPQEEVVAIPACYHESLAPDLAHIAARAGLTTEKAAVIHTSGTYTVLATGFAPGFAYLGDLDPRIAAPRREVPRRGVPTGSIGIADRRTGVYPSEGPGGWQLIGRVPAAFFKGTADRIARFRVGQRVRFEAIPLSEYEAWR